MKDKFKSKVILDTKGLLMHSLHVGTDPDGTPNEEGKIENTAEYGFNIFMEKYLIPILDTVAPRQVFATFDGGNDYRRGLYPKYKLKRSQRVSSEFASEQHDKLMKYAKSMFAALGITSVMVDKAEADDVIALLCERLEGTKAIYTVDADLLQLSADSMVYPQVENDCMVLLKGELVTGEYKGTPLHLITLEKSLVGDSSDEYQGVPGVGQAAWKHIISEFGVDGAEELDQCVRTKNYAPLRQAVADTVDKVLTRILDKKSDWELMYHIASLHPEICEGVRNGKPVKINWFKRMPNLQRAMDVATRTSTQDLLKRIEHYFPTQTLITKDNMGDLRRFEAGLKDTPFVAMDYETYDTLGHPDFAKAAKGKPYVDVLSAELTGASFTYGDNLQHTIYISVCHKDTPNLPKDAISWAMRKAEEVGPIVVQNAAFEYTAALNDLNYEMDIPYDTLVMMSHVDEDLPAGLKDCSKRYLNYQQTTYSEVVGDRAGMHELTGEEVVNYGCDDAWCTASLFDLYHVMLSIEGTWEFVKENEFAFVDGVSRGYLEGVAVDYERMEDLQAEDKATAEKGIARVRELLTANCSTVSESRAEALYKDLASFETAANRLAGGSEEKLAEKLLKLKESITAGTRYIPLQVSKKEVKFTPTAKQISKVAAAIGFHVELSGVTADKITTFLVEATATKQTKEQEKFADLLAGCSSTLRKRKGDEFDEFYAFCLEVVNRDAPDKIEGDELNFDSPQQMQIMFYAKLGLPIRVRSKVQAGSKRAKLGMDGSPGTDDKALATALVMDLDKDDWRYELLTTFREAKAAITREKMYYTPYPLWKHPKDGVIHPFIKNCGTVTRRPSGKSPNLLQVSKKDGNEGIRSLIIPRREDHVIISPDFSGQELRIMTSESLDEVLLDAYLGEVKKDVHSVTASGIAVPILQHDFPHLLERFTVTPSGIPYSEFMAAYSGDDTELASAMNYIRKVAKAVNFLIIYGGGPLTLARNLIIPVEMAKAFMEAVFKKYPGIQPWQNKVIEFGKRNGYVETAYGTRRHCPPNLFSRDENLRMRAERQMANSTIQGCAADMLKVVMRRSLESKLFRETKATLIAPVYDELTASVPKSAAVEYSFRIMEIMSLTPPGHRVPMVPELSIGAKNWGSMKELGAYPAEDTILESLETV